MQWRTIGVEVVGREELIDITCLPALDMWGIRCEGSWG